MTPYLIGVIRGSTVSPEFDAATHHYLKTDPTADPELNLKHLLAGRIDAFVEKKQLIDELLRTKYAADADKVVAVGAPLQVGKFYNTFSHAVPGYQHLLDDFNRGLKLIREDGTERAILQRFGVR
jgi:polar amino acid transport system substrate-binding protein